MKLSIGLSNKKVLTALLFISISSALIAQPKSFDFFDFQLPVGEWKENTGNDFLSYTLTVPPKGYCIIGIYKSIASLGSVDADGLADWNEFAVKRYPSVTSPTVKAQPISNTEWIQAQRTGEATHANNSILISVVTFSGYNKHLTILIENSNAEFDHFIPDFFSTLKIHPAANVNEISSNTTPSSPTSSQPSLTKPTTLVGKWKKSTASWANPSIGYYPVTQGYTRYNYEFKADNTYSFYMEQCSVNLTTMFFQFESGTYKVDGNQLTIMPRQSVFEKRGYNNGRGVPGGPLLQTQNLELIQTNYTFTFFYLDTDKEWKLILQTATPAQRDGDFSNNANFKNSYEYSVSK
jgi:hypothetical protein